MSFFEEFTISYGREKDRRIRELETQAQTDAATHEAALAVKDVRITALEADFAPFREYIAAHPVDVPAPKAPEPRVGQDGGSEAGPTAVVVDHRPPDESGRVAVTDVDVAGSPVSDTIGRPLDHPIA